jgi:hypothetical protein
MPLAIAKDRTEAKTRVLEGLNRLRARFPLEARVRGAPPPLRAAYAQLLGQWRHAQPPAADALAPDALAALVALDAVVAEEHGFGCYPFTTRDTGLRVTLPAGTVHAMCAIDALAIARLARERARISANCAECGAPLAFAVEANGGLDHDQADAAQVLWRGHDAGGACSQSLCRTILFLCTRCASPDVYTLPQAAAIGNAFFAFQAALLHSA